MLDNGRAEIDTRYLGSDAAYRMEFVLDSAMAQQLKNYTQSTSASLIIESLGALMQLGISSCADNVNTDNLIRGIMVASGAPASFYVSVQDRDRKRQEQQMLAMQQMQMQNALTGSEINRNNAGAANLNNISGNNGGMQ